MRVHFLFSSCDLVSLLFGHERNIYVERERERERQRERERALGSNGENVNKQYISGWCIQFDA